jgi:1,4-dihydroxy-2-naphthoate octaprenyltransferase
MAALSPVVIGSVLALKNDVFHWPSVLAAVLASTCIQIGTNFANDYFDFKSGKDTEKRLGPTRATSAGLVSPTTMKWAMILAFGFAIVFGAYIMWRGGWPIVVIGVLSILSGIAYTGGPYPLGYNGLGDIFVLIFFGPVAVAGTYYVQSLALYWPAVWLGLSPGLLSTALLAVNNVRDSEEDRGTGKRTLAVRFGDTFGRWEYVICTLSAFLIPGVYLVLNGQHSGYGFALGALISVPFCLQIFTLEKAELNTLLGKTGALLVSLSLFFALLF